MSLNFNENVGKTYQFETMKQVCEGLAEVCLMLAKDSKKSEYKKKFYSQSQVFTKLAKVFEAKHE